MPTQEVFPTKFYHARLTTPGSALMKQIHNEFADVCALDKSGKAWSKDNYKNGFTSYASANELHKYYAAFSELERKITPCVRRFQRELGLSGEGKLRMNTCWVNWMPENTHHGMHLHPLSVISGTYYLEMPPGASALRLEDPRLPLFMARPAPATSAPAGQQLVYEVKAKSGDLVLFESWLRHEVPINRSLKPRLSISFNYDWE